jgi:excisionase family DNA binding protein
MDKAATFTLIRPTEAASRLGISRSTLYAWLDSGTLSVRPVRLGARATAFRLDELEAWLESRSRTSSPSQN